MNCGSKTERFNRLIQKPSFGKNLSQFHLPPNLTYYFPKLHIYVTLPSPQSSKCNSPYKKFCACARMHVRL